MRYAGLKGWKNFVVQIVTFLIPSTQKDGDVIAVLSSTSNSNQNFPLGKF